MKQMRLLLVVIGAVCAAAPVLASEEQDCFQGQQPELRIKACSEIIQRVPNDATAYHNRAVAYGLAGDIDRAIADYTKVIEIAPTTASAYDNRGRAYASKGEYARAVEDETKAQALIAKAIAQPILVGPKTSKASTATKKSSTTKGPASGSWSWFNPWNTSASQSSGKNAKP